jgi:hypothetical protein
VLTVQDVSARVSRLQERYRARDARMANVAAVRAGKMNEVFPDFFSDEHTTPLVANFIDVVARDLSEAIAPLPSLNCASGVITNDRARKFANRRQRIGSYYWSASNLDLQMFSAADNYVTNGFVAAMVEPCYKTNTPKIRFMNSAGGYPDIDADGHCRAYARKWTCRATTLAHTYPEYREVLLGNDWTGIKKDREIDVVKYVDDQQCIVYLPGVKNLVLEHMRNPFGECPVVVAVRPTPDGEMHGQFDDVLGVQAAKSLMMSLAIEAAEKQVQAPIAIPDDVVNLEVGPDAVMRSANPEKIGRVSLGIGDSTFREAATLSNELMTGSRFPEGRIGNSGASVITGRGVEALMGGYDSQIKTAQIIFSSMLEKLTAKCFAMDEKLWKNKTKNIKGTVEGTPFEETYLPGKDIKGDYTCEVTYGFLAGMDPNRALVFLLQLRGDRLIDRRTVQQQMPFDVDVNALQQNIDVEEMRDALKQGTLAYVQAIGPMAQQGQDPSQILRVLAEAIKGRQTGKPLEELLASSFERMAEEKAAAEQAAQEAMMAQMGGGDPAAMAGASLPGVGPEGLLTDVAAGQAGMGPGGRPALQTLMAGLGSDGNPNIRAGVARQIAA